MTILAALGRSRWRRNARGDRTEETVWAKMLRSSRKVTTGAAGWRRRRVTLRFGDFAHGVVEGQAEDFDEEVDGVAGEILLGPAPIDSL